MTPVRLELAAPWSQVKHSTTEPLRFLYQGGGSVVVDSCTSHCLWGFCVGLRFAMHYLVSFAVLQSFCQGRESWLLCFNYLPDVNVSVLWLFLTVPLIGLQCVVVVPAH